MPPVPAGSAVLRRPEKVVVVVVQFVVGKNMISILDVGGDYL